MENGADEQVATGAEDSDAGSFTDEQSNDAGAEGGALEEGQDGGEPVQFDRNSPEARYWQSEKDKAIGKLEAKIARLEQAQATGRMSQPQEATGPSVEEIVNVVSFQPPAKAVKVLEERGLDPEAIGALVEILGAFGGHTLNGVNAYNQRAFAQQQQQTAAQKIGAFVEKNIERRDDILKIYDEMPDVAARNPDRFLKVVEMELGLSKPAQQQPPKRGLASAVTASGTRPTRNGNAPARKPAPASLRELITQVANEKGW